MSLVTMIFNCINIIFSAASIQTMHTLWLLIQGSVPFSFIQILLYAYIPMVLLLLITRCERLDLVATSCRIYEMKRSQQACSKKVTLNQA